MKILINFVVILIFSFLSFNFLFDFAYINKQINNNLNEFVYKYILFHKNSINLKSEIKDLKKERNLFRGQKKLFEKAYNDLYEENIETKNDSELLYTILEQFDPYQFDMSIKKNNSNLEYSINPKQSFSNNKIRTRIFSPQNNILLYGISNNLPGSGYLEIYEDNLILISASGILAYSNNPIQSIKKDLHFKQIKTNINKFIGEEQFKKSRVHDFDWLQGGWFSIKDINIYKDQIYVSYTREVKENCWNTSLLHGKINYKLIIFDNLFTSDECVHFYDNIDGEFNAHQSGGRIINVDDNNLLFSTGDFRSRFRAQKEDSIFSKIIEINKKTKDHKVVSMGHRNPQGLYYNKNNNFLLEAEHGPEGGDEINLIELNNDKIPNYGWAISSYGEHYGGKSASFNKKKYLKYPLHKSHSEYNFIEPVIYFNPSIGISQIVGLDKDNSYVLASMKDESLYFFEYDYNDKKINTPNKVSNGNAENIKIERVHIGERIRDMIYFNDKLYLYLEDTASIAEVYIN